MTPGSGATSTVPDALPTMIVIEQADSFSRVVVDKLTIFTQHTPIIRGRCRAKKKGPPKRGSTDSLPRYIRLVVD